MTRRRIAEWIPDEAGNALGGTGYEVRVYDVDTTTLSTLYADATSASTVPNPHYPNSGWQQATTTNKISSDTTVNVTDSSGWQLGDVVPVDNGTNRTFHTITALTATQLTFSDTLGFTYNSGTLVGGPEMRGHFQAWCDDTRDYALAVTNVASGKQGPRKSWPLQTNAGPTSTFGDGSVTVPSISFTADTNTGFYRIGADRLGVTVNGAIIAELSAAATAFIALGLNPATIGIFRIPNNTSMVVRNAANSADLGFFYLDTSNNYQWGDASGIHKFASGAIALGTNPAASGALRLPNNNSVSSRNAANSADIALLNLSAADQVQIGDNLKTVNIATTGTVALAAASGTLNFFAGVGATKQTVTGSRGGNAALASILNALDSYGLILNSSSA